MKDLSMFETVKKALEQVVSESDVNNGTRDVELLAHFWQQEYVYDKKRVDVQTKIARAILDGKLEDVKTLQGEMEALPKPKIVMEFRLLHKIPRIQGTKIISDGDNSWKISMDNISTIFVPEDAVHLGLLEYEETDDVVKDAQGRDSQVIKLVLKKGLIDIAAPVLDRYDKEIRPKRAYVTAISYGAMQNAGKLMNQERLAKRRRYGFDEQQ